VREFIGEYTNFGFDIDYDRQQINFFNYGESENIKISRGEENIFMLGVFLAIAQFASDRLEPYDWVRYIYIDDPVSSLDDNNIISVAVKISEIILDSSTDVSFIVSTHHSLFFNVLYNENKRRIKDNKRISYLFNKSKGIYYLEDAKDKPRLYHLEMLKHLKSAIESEKLYTYHFNILRSLMENTAVFLNYKDFSECIASEEDRKTYSRALNIYSHGGHSVFSTVEMPTGERELFGRVFNDFLETHNFKVERL
jgi:wobble nucleotide-excising tRNase